MPPDHGHREWRRPNRYPIVHIVLVNESPDCVHVIPYCELPIDTSEQLNCLEQTARMCISLFRCTGSG